MVAAVKRAKKRHFERGRFGVASEHGTPDGFFPVVLFGIKAPVDDLHAAVGLDAVTRTYITHAALKRVVQAGYLKPLAFVACDVKRRHCRDAFRR